MSLGNFPYYNSHYASYPDLTVATKGTVDDNPQYPYVGAINSYAHVTEYAWDGDTNSTKLIFASNDTLNLGYITGAKNTESMASLDIEQYGSFAVGEEIFLHVSTGTGHPDGGPEYLGRHTTAYIYKREVVDGHVCLWINRNLVNDFGDFSTFNQTYTLQIVTIPKFKNITLPSVSTKLYPAKWNGKCGGIFIVKCLTITFKGGAIDVTDCGLDDKSLRRDLIQEMETNGILDTDPYSGWENSDTYTHCVLNCGDGIAIIQAVNFIVNSNNSYIGNNVGGYALPKYVRSHNQRVTPIKNDRTNIGGATIYIRAKNISGFRKSLITKQKKITDDNVAYVKGLGRCYVACSNLQSDSTGLWNDEGVFALDVIKEDATLLQTHTNITSFGNGNSTITIDQLQNTIIPPGPEGGIAETIEAPPVNNYACISEIDTVNGDAIFVKNVDDSLDSTYQTRNGLVPFNIGTLVMIHIDSCENADNTQIYDGIFTITRIKNIYNQTAGETKYVLEDTIRGYSSLTSSIFPSLYSAQMISIPEFNNLTMGSETYNLKQKYQFTYNKKMITAYGGIFAIAVANELDIRDTKILTTNAGGKRKPLRTTTFMGNAQTSCRLPIGEGHGTIFLLAKHIKMNENTRLGSPESGSLLGGEGGAYSPKEVATEVTEVSLRTAAGGYKGREGLIGSGRNSSTKPYPGWAGNIDRTNQWSTFGGYFGNGTYCSVNSAVNQFNFSAAQGASVFIVADTITGFNQNAISTGGEGGKYVCKVSYTSSTNITKEPATNFAEANTSSRGFAGGHGGAGYGGGGASTSPNSSTQGAGGASGGYLQGGAGARAGAGSWRLGCSGGGSGWAFIYCNHAVDQNLTGTVADK